ncbi:MAG TPA: acetate kinase [Pseudogracilibacillus sp.]|nr:acetate kinase [Pseudogracilibacillus sp.]
MKKIMSINAGSSSLKFKLFAMPEEQVLAKGIVERIGHKNAVFHMTADEKDIQFELPVSGHRAAVGLLLDQLMEQHIIQSYQAIDAVGHRVAHGGEYFKESVLIDQSVLEKIDSLSELAPLHNPANLVGIIAFQEYLPDKPMIAVFDTAFHQTMPEKSYLYSLPYKYYEEYGIRKYGFHGTSHKYVAGKAAEIMHKPLEDLRLITCHLGNGVSVTAIEKGKSIDTTMGFTPLAGVTMGTRSGDIDPAIIPYVMRKTGKEATEIIEILNEKSGMLALSGISNDLRDIEKVVKSNKRAELALDIFADQIHEYIGSYAAKMAGVDAIIFTAGVGENSKIIRAKILKGLEFMGVYWDPLLNERAKGEATLTYPHSPVKVMVVPTDEELMIARDMMRIGFSEENK